MKVLTLFPRMPIPPRDGGAVVMLETLRELHNAGVIVDAFVLNTKRHHANPDDLQPYCRVLRAYSIDTTVTWYHALRNLFAPKRQVWAPHFPLSYWLERFVVDKAIVELVAMYREHGPYDIVDAESLFSVEMAARLEVALLKSGQTAPPILYRSHNVEHQLQQRMGSEKTRGFFERAYRTSLAVRTERNERVVVHEVDGVVTVSESDANAYRSYDPAQTVESIFPGVSFPSDDVVQNARREPDTIALLGSLEWPPNVKGAVWFVQEVMPRILKRRPNVVLHMAGRRPVKEVHDLHNGSTVILHGEVDDAHTFRMNYAVNVVSVHSGGGIRIKILDCLGMGCPVVSTTLGASGIPIISEEHLILADSADDFAEACLRLLEQPNVAMDMAMRGRMYVMQHFSWEARIRQLMNFMENLIKRKAV